MSDEDLEGDDFTAAQEGDYEPEQPDAVDEDERAIDDEPDAEFPDEERVVIAEDEPGTE